MTDNRVTFRLKPCTLVHNDDNEFWIAYNLNPNEVPLGNPEDSNVIFGIGKDPTEAYDDLLDRILDLN